MAETTPEVDAVPTDAHIYLTLDEEDQNKVLELVRSDETGMYIRSGGDWVQIDPNADDPRVWDRIIIDVTEEAATIYDEAEADGEEVFADLFDEVKLPEDAYQ